MEFTKAQDTTSTSTGIQHTQTFRFFKSKSKDSFNLNINTTFTIQPGQQKSKMCHPRRTNYLTHTTSDSVILQDKSNQRRKRKMVETITNVGAGAGAGTFSNNINFKKRWSLDMASFCIQSGIRPLAPSPNKSKYPKIQKLEPCTQQRQTLIDEFLFSSNSNSTDKFEKQEVSPLNHLQSGQNPISASSFDPYFPKLETFPPSFFNLQRKKIIESPKPDDNFNILPDEMVLKIFKWLPKSALANSALTCKRFSRLARDDVLWKRIDAPGQILTAKSLGIIFSRKPAYLRLARSSFEQPIGLSEDFIASQLLYLDLTMSVASASTVTQILKLCPALTKLSLEHLELEDSVFEVMNIFSSTIITLNITMCYNVDAKGLAQFLRNAQNLETLNMGCIKHNDWTHRDLTLVLNALPCSIDRFNICGLRELMRDEHVKIIVKRLRNLVDFDLSDSNEITHVSVESCIEYLEAIQHLAFSRCYSIEPQAYLLLTKLPNLRYLELFSLFKDQTLETISKVLTNVQFNRFPFSSIARPTVGNRRGSIWGERVRD